jgi:hypothetical protein
VVLLCFSLFCRKQARTEEIGRKSTTLEVLARAVSQPYASRILTCHDPLLRPSPLTILTSARGSHHPDTGRVQRLPPGPERPNWSPFRLNAEGYLKGWCQIRSIFFSPHFSQRAKREEIKRRARIGGILEKKQGVKIERSTWFSSLLQLKHDLFFLSIFYSLLHDVWVVYFVSRVCRSNLMLCNGSCMNLDLNWLIEFLWLCMIVSILIEIAWLILDCLLIGCPWLPFL